VEAGPKKFSASLLGVGDMDFAVIARACEDVQLLHRRDKVWLPDVLISNGKVSGEGTREMATSDATMGPVMMGDVWVAIKAKLGTPGVPDCWFRIEQDVPGSARRPHAGSPHTGGRLVPGGAGTLGNAHDVGSVPSRKRPVPPERCAARGARDAMGAEPAGTSSGWPARGR
jgi:hypothetical protein